MAGRTERRISNKGSGTEDSKNVVGNLKKNIIKSF
jgi:hypothetical protein